MYIKENGKLIADGGQEHQPSTEYGLGGGGGGIIQIIAPQGSLANNILSLTKGRGSRDCGGPGRKPNGYFLLKGNYTAISKLGR